MPGSLPCMVCGSGFRPAHNLLLYGPFIKRQRQLCDDTSDNVLIKNNGVTPDRDCNPFLSDSIVFNRRVVAALMLMLGVNGPLEKRIQKGPL